MYFLVQILLTILQIFSPEGTLIRDQVLINVGATTITVTVNKWPSVADSFITRIFVS